MNNAEKTFKNNTINFLINIRLNLEQWRRIITTLSPDIVTKIPNA